MNKYTFTVFNTLIKPSLIEALKTIDIDKAEYSVVLTSADKDKGVFSIHVHDSMLERVKKVLATFDITADDYIIYRDLTTSSMDIISISLSK